MKQYLRVIHLLNGYFYFCYGLFCFCIIILCFDLPNEQTSDSRYLFALILFIVIVTCFIIKSQRQIKRTYRYTTQAFEACSKPVQMNIEDHIEIMREEKRTASFYEQGIIIKQGYMILILPYKDIIWVHPATTSSYMAMGTAGVSMSTTLKESYLYLYSRHGIVGKCKLQNYQAIYQHLQKACPNAIFGYDKQYRKFYKKHRLAFIQLCKEYDREAELLQEE